MESLVNNNMAVSTSSGLPEERGWEYKQISVTRVQGYGFGIAVSGGRDNPHFASGDPSIAVSDVLASGPAERMLLVNDRIISVNGISLQNVEYATAVQVLRDSGDTVVLVVKRRTGMSSPSGPQPGGVAPNSGAGVFMQHQHGHQLSALSVGSGGVGVGAYVGGPPLAALGLNPGTGRVTLVKGSKKEDFGIVLGCKLFIKEISSKARDQLLQSNQTLQEGDFIAKLNNTNCNDMMSLKEAKKIIEGAKDKLHLTVARESNAAAAAAASALASSNYSHQTQSSVSTTGAVNNFYKGDDFLTAHHSHSQSYSNQNLYVQPPTRNNNPNLNPNINNGFLDPNDTKRLSDSSLLDDKSNLTPRGGQLNDGQAMISSGSGSRSRGPLSESQLAIDNRRLQQQQGIYGRKGDLGDGSSEPPRPPPPRAEDYYSSRRQLYEDDPIIQKTKAIVPDARYITFHKEGSVGIRLTGGNYVGIFVTAVQPGSPASLQGLQPGDKILKVNDMDMTGVTREEAVLYLLSLQDRIELIVQFCREEYKNIVASQKGDSFYIKTHFHYETPAKGEMSFRSGDIFHVIDTLYNGVVGCWQVFRIGRNNQEVQKGIIPNKARAEELATAQFNATKKEMSANESRGSFFRRRRSNNRRSKSLGKEHWDDILFSDTVSKFPAYERVVLKHPGFTRPVILFGPISDVSRDKLLKDFPDKFISPQLDSNLDDSKSHKVGSNIIKLSAIRDVISTGKHALLDITPNAVERLNYAQLYPIVIFFKADTKIVIKQLRQGLPKSAHKSSKKLLEQCQKLDKVWNHIFCSNITLNDNTDNWYRKVREIIDKQQTGPLWMSESKPEECLSDDFLFPMSSLRLSYASSPESDLEHSPGPSGNNTTSGAHAQSGNGGAGGQGATSVIGGRLTKASSDPSVVMTPGDVGVGGGGMGDMLPPYQSTYDTRYGFNHNPSNLASGGVSNSSLQPGSEPQTPTSPTSKDAAYLSPSSNTINNSSDPSLYGSKAPPAYSPNGVLNYDKSDYSKSDLRNEFTGDLNGKSGHKRQSSNVMQHSYPSHMKGLSISDPSKEIIYGTAPDLPPRIDRAVKPMGLTTTPTKNSNGRSAHERLFGSKASSGMENNNESSPNLSIDPNFNNKLSSLDRNQNSKSDSLSSYDSFNNPTTKHNSSRIIPNAHDDLKTTLSKIDPNSGIPNSSQSTPSKYQRWDPQQQQMHLSSQAPNHNRHDRLNSKLDLKYSMSALPPNLDLSNITHLDASPRNSRELEKDMGSLEGLHGGGARDRDYRYSRSPGKQQQQQQQQQQIQMMQQQQQQSHMETKTDYGKYSRNNSTNQNASLPSDYPSTPNNRSSQQDLSAPHLSIHSPATPNNIPQQHQHHANQQMMVNMKMSAQAQPNNNHHNGYNGGGSIDIQGVVLQQQNQMQHQGGYKPVPPPKPKNYKPPYRSGSNGANSFGASDGVMQPPLPYQHNKSHSNPVDQRTAGHMHLNPNGHSYYYNMPQVQGQAQPNGPWHTDNAVRYNSNNAPQQQLTSTPSNQNQQSSPYDLPPSYDPSSPSTSTTAPSRRHTSISYASRSEIAPLSTTNPSQQQHQQQILVDGYDGDVIEGRMHHQAGQGGQAGIVDLQGSREQRGSAFELYRKPLHHNMMRVAVQGNADSNHLHATTSHLYGSQPNLANTNHQHCHAPTEQQTCAVHVKPIASPADRKLAKAQSFKHQRVSDSLSTPKFLRRMFGKSREKKRNVSGLKLTAAVNASLSPTVNHVDKQQDMNRNSYVQASERDVTSATVDEEGATLVNHYWGVSLEIPEGAIPPGKRQEVYFVITDPRLCDNAPPLDLDNGERMLSPLVMCGPQGLEFKKNVILNIPHYANTLPSLGISLKATDSEADICTDWDNILLPSNHAANSVAVKVDHF